MFQPIQRIALKGCLLLPLAVFAYGQQPDNSKVNKNASPTADQQKETPADRELAAKIRKSVVDDKSLSTYAHNVKIIVRGGAVTLKGPVRSQAESKSVETMAQKVAGSTSAIHNEMTVAPKKKSS